MLHALQFKKGNAYLSTFFAKNVHLHDCASL